MRGFHRQWPSRRSVIGKARLVPARTPRLRETFVNSTRLPCYLTLGPREAMVTGNLIVTYDRSFCFSRGLQQYRRLLLNCQRIVSARIVGKTMTIDSLRCSSEGGLRFLAVRWVCAGNHVSCERRGLRAVFCFADGFLLREILAHKRSGS